MPRGLARDMYRRTFRRSPFFETALRLIRLLGAFPAFPAIAKRARKEAVRADAGLFVQGKKIGRCRRSGQKSFQPRLSRKSSSITTGQK